MNQLFNLMLKQTYWDKFLDLCENVVNFFEKSGLNILKVLLFFFIGIIIIKFIAKLTKKALFKTKLDHAVSKYLVTALKIVLFFVLLITSLKNLGVDTTSFIAVITTISLALSLAMETIFSNIANGIIIVMTKPFKEGDWIAISSYEGTVKDIKILYTVLTTSDNKDINIPNSHFVGNELINYNANPTRKVIMTFDCSYDSDVDLVKKIIRNCIETNDHAILDPAPIVRLKALNASSIQFQAIIHCKTSDYWSLYYELLDDVFNEFKRNNISIPFNQLEVRLLNNEVISPYRQQELSSRTNDGKFDYNVKSRDFIDKMADPLNLVDKVKTFSSKKKNKSYYKNNSNTDTDLDNKK